MNKLERLIIAAAVAPTLRDKKPRPVNTIGPDGRVVRVIDDAKLAESILARAGIELAVSDAVRKLYCKDCGTKLRTNRGKNGCCSGCTSRRNIAAGSNEVAVRLRKARAAVSPKKRLANLAKARQKRHEKALARARAQMEAKGWVIHG